MTAGKPLAALAWLLAASASSAVEDIPPAPDASTDAPVPSLRVHRDVFRQETDWFEVNAADPVAGARLAWRLREAEAALRTAGEFPEGLQVRVIVRLQPVSPGPGRAVLDVAPGGVVTLTLPEAGLEEGDEVWMVRAALVRGGTVAAGVVDRPVLLPWVERGLTETVRARINPGLAQAHARALLSAELPQLGRMLQPGGRTEDPALCWMAVRALVQVTDGRRRLLEFAREAGEPGADPRVIFLRTFAGVPEFASGVQAWWMVQAVAQAREQAGFEFTRDWPGRVRRLLQVEVERGPALEHLGAEELWSLRRRPWIRELARMRVREARLQLTEAPPLWYNGVLSAGQAWEALSRGRREEFFEAWERVPGDVRMGLDLEAEISARLADWERRLEPVP